MKQPDVSSRIIVGVLFLLAECAYVYAFTFGSLSDHELMINILRGFLLIAVGSGIVMFGVSPARCRA